MICSSVCRSAFDVVEVAATDTEADIPLPARGPDETVTIYLPEAHLLYLESVSWSEGTIEPAPRRKRLVAYGDSITQGWTTTDAGKAWPAVVGRTLGLDVINLGFAGSARGELPSAQQVSATPADLITLAFGTNCWAMIAYEHRGYGDRRDQLRHEAAVGGITGG